jgi:hypothetical protein
LAGGLGTGAKIIAAVAVSASLGAGAIGLQRGSQSGGDGKPDAAATSVPVVVERNSSAPAKKADPSSKAGTKGRRHSGESRGDRPQQEDRTRASQQSGQPVSRESGGGPPASPSTTPAVPAQVGLPKVDVPAAEVPNVVLPKQVTDRLPVDVPKAVDQAQKTVDNVTKKVDETLPPPLTDGLPGK